MLHHAVVPRWFYFALLETSVVETPGKASTPRIDEYFAAGRIKLPANDATPWCAIAANAVMELAGYEGTQSAMARSFEKSKHFVKLIGPARGAIVTFWRGTKAGGSGHVGFYVGENKAGTHVLICGGNQGDKFSLAWFPKVSATFGLVGYYWPATVPLPLVARKVMLGSPALNAGKVT